jgi:hypothetical protein
MSNTFVRLLEMRIGDRRYMNHKGMDLWESCTQVDEPVSTVIVGIK